MIVQEITHDRLQQDDLLLYIHTPFCGTCRLARTMLMKIESLHNKDIFYEMNAAFFPQFMQEAQVESVPCLLIKQDGKIVEKVYVFRSVANIYQYLFAYQPKMFTK
ncbi:MAG TPA: thioredoxin family protein [Bacillota bacterium]|nr:thioredoxin family protein [Bacillota bacterium]